MNKQAAVQKIIALLSRYAVASSQAAYSTLLPQSLTAGKLYEAHVLSLVVEALAVHESYRIQLKNSTLIPLKSAPGPINRNYPHFELKMDGIVRAEIWTDVEFISLSCEQRGNTSSPDKGDYHELDIIVSEPGLKGRPQHSAIWLGVECKNTGYTKNLLKEILGIRRELSLLQGSQPTRFSNWPRSAVPAEPPSCLMVYSTDAAVSGYSGPGQVFGIDFVYEPV